MPFRFSNISFIKGIRASFIQNKIITDLLTDILLNCNASEKRIDGSTKETLTAVDNYIWENYKNAISLDDIAEHVHLNVNYLSRLYKTNTGTTIHETLLTYRINKAKAGSNAFTLSPKRWIEATEAIGMYSKSGRGGGTFAHRDIAFEFASWISAEFKLYIIKDYQRLKSDENSRLSLNWNMNREISKINYRIHTDAIKEHLIVPELPK